MTLESLLDRYQRGELDLAQLQLQLATWAEQRPQFLESLVADLQDRVAANTLSAALGEQLLAAIQNTVAPGTKLRPTAVTRAKDTGLDAGNTLLRSNAVEDIDATRMRGTPPSDTAIAATRNRPSPSDAVLADDSSLSGSGGAKNASSASMPFADETLIIHERRAATLDAREESPASSFVPSAVIKSRFVLESMIGKGGMGLVFAAIDRRKEEARDPNSRVAIKILNTDFQSHPDALMALQREARKAQTLAHPNVVTVFDFDRDGERVFMTMELLKGRSLESVVREAKGQGIGREAAVPIVKGIAEGLAYAHRKGIVHSDLKPGNVFILADGTPKILDFGIARAVPSYAAVEQDVFDAGSLGAYTEAYATAEMVDGKDPHPADDIYALGLITYELLTGRHPYQFKSASKARELGIKVDAPQGLKRKEWKALERCLSYDRAMRPQDATEFLKLFFGTTPLQKSLVAAIVMLAGASAYFWYAEYQANGPSIAFEQLPPATQMQFKSLMTGGDQEWEFYQKDHNVVALWDAIDQYADAYKLHPRNREATHALEKGAKAFLAASKDNPEQQRVIAQALQAKSDYLSKYPPVLAAAK